MKTKGEKRGLELLITEMKEKPLLQNQWTLKRIIGKYSEKLKLRNLITQIKWGKFLERHDLSKLESGLQWDRH